MEPTPATAIYRGSMSREEGLARLATLAERMGIAPKALRIRPTRDGHHGVRLEFEHHGVSLSRSCATQGSELRNFLCLVHWLTDLVRNIERRIETFEEAFYSSGAKLLAVGTYEGFAENIYQGKATEEDSKDRIAKSLERLGLTPQAVKVEWGGGNNRARIRMRLPSGAVVDKVSSQQPDEVRNLAALALWLQSRARSFERGLEPNLEEAFASNLLLPAKGH